MIAYIFKDAYDDHVLGTGPRRQLPQDLNPAGLAERRSHVRSLMAVTASLTLAPFVLLISICAPHW